MAGLLAKVICYILWPIPFKCDGPTGEREYLGRLGCPDGKPIQFHRLGNTGKGPYGNIMDIYAIHCEEGSHKAEGFMDMYPEGYKETQPVPGFQMPNAAWR